MESTYFYETPRIPMFFIVDEFNIVRVRCLQYKDGNLYGVLADWDVDMISKDFTLERNWCSQYENPFYCMYYEDGELMLNGTSMSCALCDAEKKWNREKKSMFKSFMHDAKMLGCPIFATKKDARAYAYGTGDPVPLDYPTTWE